MSFSLIGTEIPEVKIIEPITFIDERGFFMETYKRSEFANLGIEEIFVQINRSKSTKGTLRGLHYQKHPKAQAKLVQALTGEVMDVAVDIRQGAPTFGIAVVAQLTGKNRRMLYVPAGFAHGFCVLSDQAEMCYMASAEYAPECEAGILWNDPDLAIEWPTSAPQLSKRDLVWPRLKEADNNFYYSGTRSFG
jgi:dTDP-4-dehydrorhamnose 3,5-epimerase